MDFRSAAEASSLSRQAGLRRPDKRKAYPMSEKLVVRNAIQSSAVRLFKCRRRFKPQAAVPGNLCGKDCTCSDVPGLGQYPWLLRDSGRTARREQDVGLAVFAVFEGF